MENHRDQAMDLELISETELERSQAPPRPPSDRASVTTSSQGLDDEDQVMTGTDALYDMPLNDRVFPAQILALPNEVLSRIISYALPHHESVVKPHLISGMQRHAHRSGLYNDEDVVDNENIDLSLFRISHHFHTLGIPLFYSENCFEFTNGYFCKWWIKRIGARNFALVQHMRITINSGWYPPRQINQTTNPDYPPPKPTVFDVPFEEAWRQVMTLIQHQHQLTRLQVTLHAWPPLRRASDVRAADLREEDALELLNERRRLIGKMQELRAIKKVEIDQKDCRYFSDAERATLALIMQQPRETGPAPVPARLTLADVLGARHHG